MLFLLVFYVNALINSTDTLNELRRKELYKFICYTVLTKGKHFKNKKWLVFHIQSNDNGISNHECCFALYIFCIFVFFLFIYLSIIYLSLVIILLLLLLLQLYWLILSLQVFLRNEVWQSSKQGIQTVCPNSINHVKWWIRRYFKEMG